MPGTNLDKRNFNFSIKDGIYFIGIIAALAFNYATLQNTVTMLEYRIDKMEKAIEKNNLDVISDHLDKIYKKLFE